MLMPFLFYFYEVKKKYHYLSKRKGKYFYTFYHFHSEKSSKGAKSTIYYYDPQSVGIKVQSPQSESTPRRLTLTYNVYVHNVFSYAHILLIRHH